MGYGLDLILPQGNLMSLGAETGYPPDDLSESLANSIDAAYQSYARLVGVINWSRMEVIMHELIDLY